MGAANHLLPMYSIGAENANIKKSAVCSMLHVIDNFSSPVDATGKTSVSANILIRQHIPFISIDLIIYAVLRGNGNMFTSRF